MFVRMWEFQPAAGREREFLAAYGPEGPWAELYRRAPGFAGTESLRSTGAPHRYVTIDRWRDQADYQAFRSRWADDYERLDSACEALADREREIGDFEEAS